VRPVIDVLIVGAGPTGLTAALELARRGVEVRVIDAAPGPFTGSRGKGVTARTQDVFDDLGIVDRLERSGFRHLPRRVTVAGRVVGDGAPDADIHATPDRPHATELIVPQWRTEQILRDRLAEFGVAVEYGLRAVAVAERAEGVRVTVDGAGAPGEDLEAGYLIGADGGHSTVREFVGARFEGHGGIQAMLVGDVRVDGLDPDRWYQWSAPEVGFAALCPFRDSDHWQFQGVRFADFGPDGRLPEATLERLQQVLDEVTGGTSVRLSDPAWTSRWHVNVRLADIFRRGRLFLAGDAAHVHSPAGGLGMNTGIQDAYNLGWKLAAVLGGRAAPSLLDSYADERVPIARWTLGLSTDTLTRMTDSLRSDRTSELIPFNADGQQLGLGYRWSALSHETPAFAAGADGAPLRAGDRAPDWPYADGTLFGDFRGPHVTVVGVGVAAADTIRIGDGADPSLLRAVGLASAPPYAAGDGLFVVRPDGYVGFAGLAGEADAAREYLRSIGAGAS
jgi:2-polyprenyl-6-methoxyphenol hydroxylase-like FAD-dependent oxidoreductase